MTETLKPCSECPDPANCCSWQECEQGKSEYVRNTRTPEATEVVAWASNNALRVLKKVSRDNASVCSIRTETFHIPLYLHPDTEARPYCTWRRDEDAILHSDCGESFYLDDNGSPAEHGMKFCFGCGARLAYLKGE